jgi:hypothetical protein
MDRTFTYLGQLYEGQPGEDYDLLGTINLPNGTTQVTINSSVSGVFNVVINPAQMAKDEGAPPKTEG